MTNTWNLAGPSYCWLCCVCFQNNNTWILFIRGCFSICAEAWRLLCGMAFGEILGKEMTQHFEKHPRYHCLYHPRRENSCVPFWFVAQALSSSTDAFERLFFAVSASNTWTAWNHSVQDKVQLESNHSSFDFLLHNLLNFATSSDYMASNRLTFCTHKWRDGTEITLQTCKQNNVDMKHDTSTP